MESDGRRAAEHNQVGFERRADDPDRSGDLHHDKAARYQLRYIRKRADEGSESRTPPYS